MRREYYAVYRVRSNTDIKRMPNLREGRNFGTSSMFIQTQTKFRGRKEDYLYQKYSNPGNGHRLIVKTELRIQDIKMNLLLGMYPCNQ